MIRWLGEKFRMPSILERARADLEEAERDVYRSRSEQEYWQHTRNYNEAKAIRLRALIAHLAAPNTSEETRNEQ